MSTHFYPNHYYQCALSETMALLLFTSAVIINPSYIQISLMRLYSIIVVQQNWYKKNSKIVLIIQFNIHFYEYEECIRISRIISRLAFICFVKQSILKILIINYQMSSTPKGISPHNTRMIAQLEALVHTYPFSNQRLLQLLLTIQLEDNDAPKLSAHIQKIFNTILINIFNVQIEENPAQSKMVGLPPNRIAELKEVLKTVFKSQQNKAIKRTLIITFIENILECLGVSDLTEILSLISDQICTFSSSLEESEQTKLLRIINHLLKRISKTEDYRIRGQLHFTLTRFLPLCHDSGFNYRSVPAKASQWQKIDLNDEALKNDLPHQITYQFYQEFWELQKYFMDLNELQSSDVSATPGSKGSESLLTPKLKKIVITLKEVEAYFNNHLPKQQSQYYSQPLKFLKNFKLLQLQLNDPIFRKIIMLQTLIFTFSLSNQTGKGAITLTESDKKNISEIDEIAKKYLLESGPELLEQTQRLFANQAYWVEMKDSWKDKKKTFFKKKDSLNQEEAKHKAIDMDKKRQQIRRQINQKMKIQGKSLTSFIANRQPLVLQKAPTCTSFSYYYSQALSCLNSFDKQTGKQYQFETRSEYNMFEWKAMRSLYRENIRDMWAMSDKCPPKMKEYRLISLMHRKEEDNLGCEPQKKIKQD